MKKQNRNTKYACLNDVFLSHCQARAEKNGMAEWGARFDGITIQGLPELHKQELWVNTFPQNLAYFLFPSLSFHSRMQASLSCLTLDSLCRISGQNH